MKYLSIFVLILLIVTLPAITGCSSDETRNKTNGEEGTESPDQQVKVDSGRVYEMNEDGVIEIPYEMSGVPFDLRGEPVEVAGAIYKTASQWKNLGAGDDYVAHFSFGPLNEDQSPAELVIYRPDEDETVDQARLRWIYRMCYADGRDPRTAALVHTREVGGMQAHVLSMAGGYLPPGQSDTLFNYRLVGVVLEAPEGKVYFQLTGPEYTARIMIEPFMTAIYQLREKS